MLVYPIVDVNFNRLKCSLNFSTIKLLLLPLWYLINFCGDALRLCNCCFSADFHLCWWFLSAKWLLWCKMLIFLIVIPFTLGNLLLWGRNFPCLFTYLFAAHRFLFYLVGYPLLLLVFWCSSCLIFLKWESLYSGFHLTYIYGSQSQNNFFEMPTLEIWKKKIVLWLTISKFRKIFTWNHIFNNNFKLIC